MRKLLLLFVFGILIGAGYYYRAPIFDFLTPDPQGPDIVSDEPREAELKYRFAVSVDNALPARPQTGLSRADFVIESPAEGSFTRILGFFQSQEVSRIGPVRSARPYFIDWALGFDAILVHSGGSRQALAELRSNPEIKNIDQFYNSQYIKRDSNHPAPHNLFTSSSALTERAEKVEWRATDPARLWPETERSLPATGTTTKEVIVRFANPAFDTKYIYDKTNNIYMRFLAGDAHIDALTGEQIEVANLVVLETISSVIDPNLLTIDLKTLGSGKATVFQNGEVVSARWRKLSPTQPLEILEADNTPIEMNKGLTWFAVINQFGSLAVNY